MCLYTQMPMANSHWSVFLVNMSSVFKVINLLMNINMSMVDSLYSLFKSQSLSFDKKKTCQVNGQWPMVNWQWVSVTGK